MKSALNWYENEKIKELLIGRKVIKVDDYTLELDNGTLLKFHGNEGCGGCSSGWYDVTELNGCDNMIMNVEFVDDPDSDDGGYGEGFRIFVYADNKKINLLTVEGTDGNGYYGTGYWIEVTT